MADNFLVSLKFTTKNSDVSATTGRPLFGISIVNLGRLVIPIDYIIICELLIIQGNFDYCVVQNVARWRHTLNLGRIQRLGAHSGVDTLKVAKSRV